MPTFDLGIDNVEIWTNKVELLLMAWPCNRVQELATRLVLGCKGTEFQKLQLHRSEMIINDPTGIQRIVELVGGKWGAVPLEKEFELVEKALYRGQQRADETSDSYLSRCDVIWIELISKKIDLKEIQAYILLRGSRLGSDDKKRVIVDSGAEKGGEFEVAKVEAAVCMIGSGFFQDMVGAKRDKRLKTYDRLSVLKNEMNTMRVSLKPCGLKRNISMTALSRSWQPKTMRMPTWCCSLKMLWQRPVRMIQNSAVSTLRIRRRERASQKRRDSVKRGEKGIGKKGKGEGEGKGSPANRIANSYCRICLKNGHWKNECQSRSSSSVATPSTAPTSFVTASEVPEEMFHLTTTDERSESKSHESCFAVQLNVGTIMGKRGISKPSLSCHRSQQPSKTSASDSDTADRVLQLHQLKLRCSEPRSTEEDSESDRISLFASAGSVGIVDLGASQTVIGSRQVPEFLSQMPEWVRRSVKRQPRNLIFRFGSQQTFVSKHALMVPLGDDFFRIVVVEGSTPFLISSAF